MKFSIGCIFLTMMLLSCTEKIEESGSKSSPIPLVGTWKLFTAIIIEKGDTTVTDYTKNISFIKIINDTHFAFLQHDLNKGTDSSAVFVAGGGSYSLNDSIYAEHLEYCSARNWEGHHFQFNVDISNDTLVQSGVEIVESAGINRINIEKYVRLEK